MVEQQQPTTDILRFVVTPELYRFEASSDLLRQAILSLQHRAKHYEGKEITFKVAKVRLYRQISQEFMGQLLEMMNNIEEAGNAQG